MYQIHNVQNLTITKDLSLKKALVILDDTGIQILLVTDKLDKLCGILTDGDIRRHLLMNGSMDAKISKVMNKEYVYVNETNIEKIQTIFATSRYNHVPVVDSKGCVLDLFTRNKDKLRAHIEMEMPVVIMAGGKGSRLDPLTRIIPKPLVPIGDITMIEKIMELFHEQGFFRFYIIVNHKKDLIISYLSGLNLPFEINFIEEEEFLGTAGGLKLLDKVITGQFLLTNCDILVNTNYQSFIDWHQVKDADISILGVKTKLEIQYGVIDIDEDNYVTEIREKPNYHHFVVSGVYILDASIFDSIPSGQKYDMDELIRHATKDDCKVTCFPIEDGWHDMGRFAEYRKLLMHLDIKY